MTVISGQKPVAIATPHSTGGTLPLDALVAEVAARRGEFDRLGHVPPSMIACMKQAGIFRASTPARFGGDALPPASFLHMLERIAEADGSAAWVAAFGSANTYLAALPLDTQRQIYATGPDQVFAGANYPVQRATPVEGGYLATGRWRFASGCMGADWLGVGIGVEEPGREGLALRLAVFPARGVEIVPNWDMVGMRGTGSHDLRLDGAFVAADWTCARAAGAGGPIDEPLYRYPSVAYQAQVHAVCNIGMARAALDLAAGMAGGGRSMPGLTRLANQPYFRIELGRSEAAWRGARAYFYETAEQAWDYLLAGDPVPAAHANLMRLAATHAAHSAAAIIQAAYRIGGMAAAASSHRLQQLVRDSMVVTQHAALNEVIFDHGGGMLAGVVPTAAYP